MKCKHCGKEMNYVERNGEAYYVCHDCRIKSHVDARPSSKKKKKKNHLIDVIGITCILLIMVGGAFYLWQSGLLPIGKTQGTVKTNDSPNSYTVDGITVTAKGFEVEPYSDDSGKYTQRVCISLTFENNTNEAFGYLTSCAGKLPDGYQLETWADISTMDLNQIPSNSSKEVTMYLLSGDRVDLSKITVTYDFMDYDREYWDDFGLIMSGKMSQQEYEDKYGDVTELEFELTR